MKLRPAPNTDAERVRRALDFQKRVDAIFWGYELDEFFNVKKSSRALALLAMGLPYIEPKPMSEEDLLAASEMQEFEINSRPARLEAQSAAARLADALEATAEMAASTFEAAQQNSFQAHDLPADPQASGLGLAFLALTPRILAQRPISARVCAGLLH